MSCPTQNDKLKEKIDAAKNAVDTWHSHPTDVPKERPKEEYLKPPQKCPNHREMWRDGVYVSICTLEGDIMIGACWVNDFRPCFNGRFAECSSYCPSDFAPPITSKDSSKGA